MSRCKFLTSLTWSNCKLQYDNPEDFYLQRWQTTKLIDSHYLIFRFLFLFAISSQIHLLSRFTIKSDAHLAYIYFTHWTFLSMGVYALAHLILVVVGYTHQTLQWMAALDAGGQEVERIEPQILDAKCLHRAVLVLANISHNCAICVSVCFWSAFWTQEENDVTWAVMMYHVWLAMIIVWNYVLVSIPFRIELAYWPFGFGLAYSLFSAAYIYCGGVDHKGRRYVYKLVDWERSPWVAVAIVIVAMIFVLVVQIVLFWLDRGKMWIYRKCLGDADEGVQKRSG